MAFYHRYRPQSFEDIRETQPAVYTYFRQSLIKDQLSHVYLFVGSHGIGKTSVARILAKAVNCTGNDAPCNQCEHCQAIGSNSFSDVYELDAASNRGIDEVRRLQDLIKLSPTFGGKKVYIIDEVHMLTTEAFNALLKTFEEPPASRLFILCTTELHKVPQTVRSRATTIDFQKPDEQIITIYLKKIATTEKLRISDQALAMIAKAADGAFRDAAKLLEQAASLAVTADSAIDVEMMLPHLHMGSQAQVTQFVRLLLSQDLDGCVGMIRELELQGCQAQLFVKEVIQLLRGYVYQQVKKDTTSEYKLPVIVKSIDLCLLSLQQMKGSPLPFLPLEIALLKSVYVDTPTPPVPVKQTVPTVAKKEKEVLVSIPPPPRSDHDTNALGSAVVAAAEVLMPAADTAPPREHPPEFQEIKARWKEFVSLVKDSNASVASVLRTAQPVMIDGKAIHVSTTYRFHKDRLETTKNRQLIESALFELFGMQLRLTCVLSTQTTVKKKDLENVQQVSDEGLVEAALEIFAN